MYTGKEGYGVNSSLMYGIQWDSIMKWIEEEKNVSNSTTWGNHYGRAYTIPAGTEYYNGTSWVTATSDINKTTSYKYLLKNRRILNNKTSNVTNTEGVTKKHL